MNTTLKDKIIIVRKSHQCFSCLRIFPKNSEMRYWAGVFEGDFSHSYACITCVEIMDLSESDEGGYPQGFVHEMLDIKQTPEQLLKQISNEKSKNSIRRNP